MAVFLWVNGSVNVGKCQCFIGKYQCLYEQIPVFKLVNISVYMGKCHCSYGLMSVFIWVLSVSICGRFCC